MNLRAINSRKLLIGLTLMIVICVLIFNVFYFSAYYGFVQVNYINSILLIPFVALIFSFGMLLGNSAKSETAISDQAFELTEREREIAHLILSGKKNKDIAALLFIELSTVKSHINNIYKKTEVKNRRELTEKLKDQ
ncbi:hypothetical protein GWK08_18075 [Leptobacterium flavescens]|uniref:HTH luxR-type domain-containing protein n=1 Tax=Leptobacterium flavescens TaxID=472055 RepID=A0A6P0UTN2_9FLAO|nr:helix-turn-helix transcriptional regulator [Leptobacterium flavescens]NER15368.1 hypothetical protein [Leptobacterium flavescens]